MSSEVGVEIVEDFAQTLVDCRRLYVESGRRCAVDHPDLLTKSPSDFVEWMDDLHRGLLVKIYFDVALADQRWRPVERELAQRLLEHVWGRRLAGEELKEAAIGLCERVRRVSLYSLIRPFAEIAPLRDRVAELETVVMRMANLVAKADQEFGDSEARRLHSLREELERHLSQLPFDTAGHHEECRQRTRRAVQCLDQEAQQVRQDCALPPTPAVAEPPTAQDRLRESLDQLDQLVGLAAIKEEIRTLTNFLKVQRQRAEVGLPRTPLSLHMVFAGNPGTGKTTVARIVGRILGAMGILSRGHLIETDRSGLVASYAGQTGPKTNKLIDEALDGVLFVDEAYSLVGEGPDDAFGHEALQTLLKRMEDDRHRLVIILAGYSQSMERLLHANPGLSSRISRSLHFHDYTPSELGRIFEQMCRANHYQIPAEVRHRLLLAFHWLYTHRDERFGNGRLVRNFFEDAIRRLANRVADNAQATRQLLIELRPEDILAAEVPASVWQAESDAVRYRVPCPGCQSRCTLRATLLGHRVRCRRCGTEFPVDWADPKI